MGIQDSRVRYFYKLLIKDKIIFSGFLLHEEAWNWLVSQNEGSISYEKGKISKKSDLLI